MTPGTTIADLTRHLDVAGIPFMLAGSIASSIHGEPRSTQDVDIVIDPTDAQLLQFVAALESTHRYYVSPEAARAAFVSRSMFNVIDLDTGWKADLILRKHRPYSAEEFRRRTRRTLEGVETPVTTPEDTILSKLEWAKESGSDRQYRDAVNVAVAQFDTLDRPYLDEWAAELGVADALRRVLAEADSRRRPA